MHHHHHHMYRNMQTTLEKEEEEEKVIYLPLPSIIVVLLNGALHAPQPLSLFPPGGYCVETQCSRKLIWRVGGIYHTMQQWRWSPRPPEGEGRGVARSLVANANRKAAESFSRARFVACSLSNFGTGTRGGIRQTLSVHYRLQDVTSHRKGKHHRIFKMFGV